MHASRLKNYFIFCTILSKLTTTNSYSKVEDEAKQITFQPTTVASLNFVPYRYNRYILFFFSVNVTVAFFKETILKKLIEFDNYCGGENYQTTIYLGSSFVKHDYETICQFCTIDSFLGSIDAGNQLNFAIERNVSAGAIDTQDVGKVLSTLMQIRRNLNLFVLQPKPVKIITQAILITDYATDSIKNDSETVLKSENIQYIALTTNLPNATAAQYFPEEIWNLFSSFTNWTPDGQLLNPICGNKVQNYATPIPSFNDNFWFDIYLLLSSDYVSQTELIGVIELLHQLTMRRWAFPCRQYRVMKFRLSMPIMGQSLSSYDSCNVDDLLGNAPTYASDPLCSSDLFSSWVHKNTWGNFQQSVACDRFYTNLFADMMQKTSFIEHKFLLITDVPIICPGFANKVNSWLSNNNDNSSAAPLTVIAIDKENDKSVASSFVAFFPAAQMSNLYEVNNISQLLENINKRIKFCLNLVPWFDQRNVSYNKAVWFFYLIGAAILTMLIMVFAFYAKRRSRKRREKVCQIRDHMEMVTTTIQTTKNQYKQSSKSTLKDPWEVILKSLDINYVTIIGKGAFSIVHSGYLHGKAPIVDMTSSIALQQFSDCNVAVKTVPQHSTESERQKFRDEIRLMKEIGYNVHLVSMLGCNCSINRPILVMELAKQDLLHWLTDTKASATDMESNFEKTLLSISWQISDGMSYLSSKNFIHRDLAARNILLNNELKAMVSDFGLCQKLDTTEQVVVITGGKLPIKWMAPESLQDHKFSIKTDVYEVPVPGYHSLGVQTRLWSKGPTSERFQRDEGSNFNCFRSLPSKPGQSVQKLWLITNE